MSEIVREQKWEWIMPYERKEGYFEQWVLVRLKVPGGWLVMSGSVKQDPYVGLELTYYHNTNSAPCFYPDPQHSWDGGSLP